MLDVLKKILLKGFFVTMVDESINKYARRIVMALVTICLGCGVIVLTTLAITTLEKVGVWIYWACDIALVLFIVYIYVKLSRHLKKRKQDEAKDEAIRQRIRERKEKEYQVDYEHNNRYHT